MELLENEHDKELRSIMIGSKESGECLAVARIILTTCILSGRLYDFNHAKFNYVFVQEAEWIEPIPFIPIGLVEADGLICLAGAQEATNSQNVLFSSSVFAKESGLPITILERLTKLPLYRRSAASDRYISKLEIAQA